MLDIKYIHRFLLSTILLTLLIAVPVDSKAQLENKMPKFVRNIMHACTDMDTAYAVHIPWNASVEARTALDQEWIKINSADGLKMQMKPDVAYRVGPYVRYGSLSVGYLFRLNPTGRRKNINFSVGLNTNLVSLDFVYKRTGGDFKFTELSYPNDGGLPMELIKNKEISAGITDNLYNTIFSTNVYFYTNHKKYSNSAVSGYGYIQKMSAGSPILGLGYTFQKLETEISQLTSISGIYAMKDGDGRYAISNPNLVADGKTFVQHVEDLGNSKTDEEGIAQLKYIANNFPDLFKNQDNALKKVIYNAVPTATRIYDWHMHVGYAYSFVLTKHLMIGAQCILSPAIKRYVAENTKSIGAQLMQDSKFAAEFIIPYDLEPTIDIDRTSFGFDVSGRLSVRWHNKQWYAGLTSIFYGNYYDRNNLSRNYNYWDARISVGYNFDLKSLFKKKGS